VGCVCVGVGGVGGGGGGVGWGGWGGVGVGGGGGGVVGLVMVLSHSRQIFLRFYLDARMENFLRGHVAAFASWGGVPRVLLYEYVPGNIFVVMCPDGLCVRGCARR